jgi:hypothetical protein
MSQALAPDPIANALLPPLPQFPVSANRLFLDDSPSRTLQERESATLVMGVPFDS